MVLYIRSLDLLILRNYHFVPFAQHLPFPHFPALAMPSCYPWILFFHHLNHVALLIFAWVFVHLCVFPTRRYQAKHPSFSGCLIKYTECPVNESFILPILFLWGLYDLAVQATPAAGMRVCLCPTAALYDFTEERDALPRSLLSGWQSCENAALSCQFFLGIALAG